MNTNGSNRGFTLIEVLVVVSIIAIVMALLIPAVSAVREMSRRSQCQNNLKQIGLALNQYANSHSVLPQGQNGLGYSHLTMLLPFVEQAGLYNTINFAVWDNDEANDTVMVTNINVLLCPSDPRASRGPAITNYAGNGGYNIAADGFNGTFANPSARGPFIGFSAITDGISATSAFSEWVIGNVETIETNGIVFQTIFLPDSSEFDKHTSLCANVSVNPRDFFSWAKLGSWVTSGFNNSLLNHNMIINSHTCINGSSIDLGSWTAGSKHSSGANVLFLDGHVQFVKDQLDINTWRALSTRSASDIISNGL